ncbi:MAG: hypothetical protein CFE44_21750 [Burkholderiales bacterium PBB4]|nr:MAG: hypothetical protein CFE44_21750 [Burkholderiales bacterium PBB4]
MTWIIIILLALILVALMNSNQNSAQAVKKVIRFAAIGSLVLAAWLLLLGALIWSNTLNNSSTWSYVVTVAFGVLVPPAVVWLNFKAICQAFEKDRVAATKQTLKIGGFVALMISAMVAFQLLKKEGLDVIVLIAMFIFTGMKLVSRTLARPQFRHEIWFGLDQPENIFFAMDEAKRVADEKEEAIREDEDRIWDTMAESERDTVRAARVEREKETAIQLQLIEASLKAQHEAWSKQSLWSVHYVFWLSSIALACTILGKAWDSL